MIELFTNLWRDFSIILGWLLLAAVGVCLLVAAYYRQRWAITRGHLKKVKKSFEELDEQAKLIIKTDLELNKTQEELDKRFVGLNALQKISRLVSTTLIEDEIFERLNQPLLTELGFEKYLIIIWNTRHEPVPRVKWEFSDIEAENILKLIQENRQLLQNLKRNLFYSSDATSPKQPALKIPQVIHFVIAPIVTQNKMLGLILAGHTSKHAEITPADKEIISILADQVSQAVRNARLFEEVYLSHQGLELKVNERTKQLTKALEEVQKISKTKTQFISAVSHELRTPLTSIKGYASILMAGKVGQIPPGVKDRLAKINKHSDNLVKMINDLLDISRIESGRAAMKYAPQSLAPILENIKDLMAPQLKEKDVNFVIKIADGLPKANMDTAQIERVFINLVSNAVKFTPQHGQIIVEAEYDDDNITVTVSDSGIGIRKDDLSHLFEEFYRADNEINQSVKGTGLGLSLVKRIVEAHKGKIWVNSQINKGTTFHFTLPLTKPET